MTPATKGPPTVTDHSLLVTRLMALAANDSVFIGGARVLSQAGAPAPLTAMIAEIDATVLARTLVFDIDGVVLRMAVAGRRLRGLIDIAGISPSATALTGRVLAQDDIATTKTLGAFLADLCKDAQQVTVRSHPAEPLGTPSEAGIPAASLAGLWQVVDHGTGQSRMARFLAVNSPMIFAFIHATAGVITSMQGDTAKLDPIWREQFAAFRKRQQAIFAHQDGPLLVCLDGGSGDGHGVAIAMTGDEASVFAYESAAISTILTSWHRITH
jgi:hypothetical protein